MTADPHDRTITFALAAGLQSVREVAEQIVDGDVFTDADAVRVAEAYLAVVREEETTP